MVDTLLNAPDAFHDHIAISPSLWWDGGRVVAPDRLTDIPDGRRLYLAIANEGATMREGFDALVTGLDAGQHRVAWRVSGRSASETHATIDHGAALDALRWLYGTPYPEGETPKWMTRDGAPPAVETEPEGR